MTNQTLLLGILWSAVGGCGGGGGVEAPSAPPAADGGAPAVDCTQFFSAPPPKDPVTFTVKNSRPSPVYLMDGTCTTRFAIGGPGITSDMRAEQPLDFDLTCEMAHRRGLAWECNHDGVVPLAPGATTTLSWAGLVYDPRTMPKDCYHPPVVMVTPCGQGVVPMAGAMQVYVSLVDAADCPDGGAACYPKGSSYVVAQSFNFPGDPEVLVDIQ